MFGRSRIPLASFVAFLLARTASADSLVLTADRDNTLFESPTGSLSNGAGAYLFAGSTSRGLRRRGLVHFDLTAVPPGSTVTHATLQLFMSFTIAASEEMTVHRVLADWGEGTSDSGGTPASGGGTGATSTTNDATWIHRFFPSTTWSAAGGDFVIAPSASQVVAPIASSYAWNGPQLIADVQNWLRDPTTNYGWALIGPESSTETAQRFNTRENPDATTRPQLLIEYTPAAPAPFPRWASAIFGALLALAGGHLARRSAARRTATTLRNSAVRF